MSDHLVVYVGCDPREPRGFQVCKRSIELAAEIAGEDPPAIVDLTLERCHDATGRDFREEGASTAFTRTRFLTPWLARAAFPDRRYALFCDCDFVFTADVGLLPQAANGAVAVVQMDSLGMYRATHAERVAHKMDGQAQEGYPRKWWSALMLFDLDDRALDVLDPDAVASFSPRYLHRFMWLEEDRLGALPPTWHWVDGYSPPSGGLAAGIHFTRGTPELGWHHTTYSYLWHALDRGY